jgi:putative acetyltransferase
MLELRPATVADQPGLIALIDSVYGEYGDRVCLEGAEADLLDVESNYRGRGGELVVLVEPGSVRGAHGVVPSDGRPGVCHFRRLYLDATLRGQGWGARLMQWAIDWSRAHGMTRVEFWSDVRFSRAHAFFGRWGFERGGIREMHDGYAPYKEYFFSLELNQPPGSGRMP